MLHERPSVPSAKLSRLRFLSQRSGLFKDIVYFFVLVVHGEVIQRFDIFGLMLYPIVHVTATEVVMIFFKTTPCLRCTPVRTF